MDVNNDRELEMDTVEALALVSGQVSEEILIRNE